MNPQCKKTRPGQAGFTLLEMLIATVVMLVGLVAVAQLVPLSVRLNSGNRADSTALVFAQREMDELVDQPMNVATFTDPQGVLCPPLANCNLGNAAAPLTVVGSPVVIANNRPIINFNAAQVGGYGFNYRDPNDPFALPYDVRWAVITYSNAAGNATGRRFIVGVLRRGGNAPFFPVNLDTMVEK